MRIVYGIFIATVCIALLVGVQKWRGPVVPGLMVEMLPLELRIVASGEVRYQSLAHIGSEMTGTVIARHVREGDRVNKGDLLIELNPDELQSRLAQAQTLLQQLQDVRRPQAQTALVEARDNLRQASREARRREALADTGTISTELAEQAQRIELNAKTALTRAKLAADSLVANSTEEQLLQQRIHSAEAELAKTRLYAPFAGHVQTRNVEPGDLVQPNKVLLEIARSDGLDLDGNASDGLEVVIALDEKNFAPVQLKQSVQLIADAWPEQTVPGIFELGVRELDSRYVYTGLKQAQTLLDLPGGITILELKIADVFSAEYWAQRIKKLTGLHVQSWMESNGQLLNALSSQAMTTQMIRVFVALSVIFGIASVLAVSVVQRTREIGILRAMGSSQQQILRVFLLRGGLLGLAGSLLGVVVGYTLVQVLNNFGELLFVIRLEPSMLLSAIFIATAAGVIAAAVPARRAARYDPAVAIRYV